MSQLDTRADEEGFERRRRGGGEGILTVSGDQRWGQVAPVDAVAPDLGSGLSTRLCAPAAAAATKTTRLPAEVVPLSAAESISRTDVGRGAAAELSRGRRRRLPRLRHRPENRAGSSTSDAHRRVTSILGPATTFSAAVASHPVHAMPVKHKKQKHNQ